MPPREDNTEPVFSGCDPPTTCFKYQHLSSLASLEALEELVQRLAPSLFDIMELKSLMESLKDIFSFTLGFLLVVADSLVAIKAHLSLTSDVNGQMNQNQQSQILEDNRTSLTVHKYFEYLARSFFIFSIVMVQSNPN